jgi:oligopeptide transport system permease protein
MAVLLGLTVGVAAALRPGRLADQLAVALCLVGISLPTFVVGSGLVMVFGVWLRAVPIGGWGDPRQVWLPALTLALPYAAYIARLVRNALIEVYQEDYIRTARAKGLPERRVLLDPGGAVARADVPGPGGSGRLHRQLRH